MALDRRSLADQIKDALIAEIAEGTLKPGDRLIELSIAKTFGTSQAPVREALRAMEALRLIEMRRNKGAVVRGTDPKELAEIYAVRAALETLAAGLVAETQPQAAAPLLDLCARMEQAVSTGDRMAFVEQNAAFHRQIVEASGNETLLGIWDSLDIRLRTALNTLDQSKTMQDALAAHRAIATAIQRGDAEAARRAVSHHIEAVAPESG